MRILIIGGTAFMGPHVARQLHHAGHQVTVFHRGRTEAELPAEIIHLREPDSPFPLTRLPASLRELEPDVVLHMIALGEADAHAAMDLFRGVARRIVVASSADVYRAYGRLTGTEPGEPDPTPLDEDAPRRDKRYPYRGAEPRAADAPDRWTDDYDKILVEGVVLGDAALPATVLRLPMVYGPGDRQHRLWQYLKRMDDGRPAILLDDVGARWRTCRGYVENVADAIALAVTDERAAGRVYNVAEPEALGEAAWVRAVGAAAGWHGDTVVLAPEHMPAHLAPEGDLRNHLELDSGRIRRELGYSERIPRTEALERTVAWERQHPPEHIDTAAFDYQAEDRALGREPRSEN